MIPAESAAEHVDFFAAERPHGRLAAQVLAFIVARAALLGSTLLVARTAGAAGFGPFALAAVVFQAGLLLRDAGLGQALIVLGGASTGAAWPVFLITSALGTGIGLAMALAAGPVASLLGIPDASGPTWVLSLAFVTGSLGVASIASLERSLRFVTRAAIDVGSYLALALVAVVGLQGGLGVTALAWGYVAQGAVQAAVAIVLVPPWRARRERTVPVRPLLGYGGLLWLSALLSYIAANLDNVLVAAMGGAAALGLYSVSYTIGCTVPLGLSQVVNRMALAWYGRDRGDPVALARSFRALTGLALGLSGVVAAVVVLLAPEIVAAILGPGTSPWPVVVLATYSLVRVLGASLGTLLNGVGAASLTVRAAALNVTLMIVSIPGAMIAAGATGVALAVLASMGASALYLAWHLEGQIRERNLRRGWPSLLFGAGGAVVLAVGSVAILPLRLALAGAVVVGGSAWLSRHIGLLPRRRP